MSLAHALWLGAAWVGYFILHSLAASLWLKHWVAAQRPAWLPGYRLAYNLVAMLLLVPPLWLTFWPPTAELWVWRGPWAVLANGLALAALVGFVVSLRSYDTGEFLGLRQWRARTRRVEDQESLHLSVLHRWVRHPWYSLGLVILWTRDMTAALLLSSLLATLYLVIGSRLEERKLLAYHGEAYRRYRQRVPGLVPWPGRVLSATEAQALEARARAENDNN